MSCLILQDKIDAEYKTFVTKNEQRSRQASEQHMKVCFRELDAQVEAGAFITKGVCTARRH